jgi:uncharacterized membrane protein HdeD (DUF308 family)
MGNAMSFMQPPGDADYLRAHWWAPLLRGLLSIVFGFVLFALPLSAVFTLVILFGAFAFADGVLAIVQALRFAHPNRGRWWVTILQGAAGILIGVITFFYPGITAQTLGLLIAVWAIVTGVFEIATAIRLRRDLPNEFFLIFAGVLSLVLGLLLVIFPIGALIGAVYFIAAYAVISGVALIALAFRLRRGSRTGTGRLGA